MGILHDGIIILTAASFTFSRSCDKLLAGAIVIQIPLEIQNVNLFLAYILMSTSFFVSHGKVLFCMKERKSN